MMDTTEHRHLRGPSLLARENQRGTRNHGSLSERGEAGHAHQGIRESCCVPPSVGRGSWVHIPRRRDSLRHGIGDSITFAPFSRGTAAGVFTPSLSLSRRNWKPPGACRCSTDSRLSFTSSAATPGPRRHGCRWRWRSSRFSGMGTPPAAAETAEPLVMVVFDLTVTGSVVKTECRAGHALPDSLACQVPRPSSTPATACPPG